MTWKTFADAIHNSEMTTNAPWKIVVDLFSRAGKKADLSEQAVRSWFSENRNCKVIRYFPDGKINYEEVFRYFRDRPDNKLQQLQKLFRDQVESDLGHAIDTETTNLDRFCWSLVNQFLDLLGLQRIDVPNISAPAKDEATETSPPSNSPKMAGYQSEGKARELKLRVPHIERCCFYCVNWLYEEGSIVNQRCPKCPNPKQGSSSPVCKDYEPNRRLIDKMKSRGADISDLI